jgi:hypothetical protein
MSVQAGMASGATIAVALRFYTRFIVLRSVGHDDWLMLAALVRLSLPHPTISMRVSSLRTSFADMIFYI